MTEACRQGTEPETIRCYRQVTTQRPRCGRSHAAPPALTRRHAPRGDRLESTWRRSRRSPGPCVGCDPGGRRPRRRSADAQAQLDAGAARAERPADRPVAGDASSVQRRPGAVQPDRDAARPRRHPHRDGAPGQRRPARWSGSPRPSTRKALREIPETLDALRREARAGPAGGHRHPDPRRGLQSTLDRIVGVIAELPGAGVLRRATRPAPPDRDAPPAPGGRPARG